MLYDDDSFDFPKCERQVVFNASLDCIGIIEKPVKRYDDPIFHLLQADKITWENVGDYVPFLEVTFFQNQPGYYSYEVCFIVSDELTEEQWKKIRNAISSAAQEFEQQRIGTSGRIFYPKHLDQEHADKEMRISRKRAAARIIKQRYKEITDGLKKMRKSGAKPSDIAKKYNVNERKVAEFLNSDNRHGAKPAEIATYILLTEMENKGLCKLFDIYQPGPLRDEILYRKSPFKGRKEEAQVVFSKKAAYISDEAKNKPE